MNIDERRLCWFIIHPSHFILKNSVPSSQCKVQSAKFKVQSAKFKVQSAQFRVQHLFPTRNQKLETRNQYPWLLTDFLPLLLIGKPLRFCIPQLYIFYFRPTQPLVFIDHHFQKTPEIVYSSYTGPFRKNFHWQHAFKKFSDRIDRINMIKKRKILSSKSSSSSSSCQKNIDARHWKW